MGWEERAGAGQNAPGAFPRLTTSLVLVATKRTTGLPDLTAPETVELPGVWVGLETVPVLLANQFIGQVSGDGEILLALGQVTPPPAMGTREEQRQQLEAIPYLPIRPIARVALTRPKLRELIEMLQKTEAKYAELFSEGRKT
jgi:hypothetical protein